LRLAYAFWRMPMKTDLKSRLESLEAGRASRWDGVNFFEAVGEGYRDVRGAVRSIGEQTALAAKHPGAALRVLAVR
jgi:hypothetical protein